jgi:hypothetical protein
MHKGLLKSTISFKQLALEFMRSGTLPSNLLLPIFLGKTIVAPQFALENAGKGIQGESGAIAEVLLSKVLAPGFVHFRLLFCRLKLLPPLRR